jgi:hypothetical protein
MTRRYSRLRGTDSGMSERYAAIRSAA